MAVTIDELQIEIQAKGAESASGIDALTTSLAALKKMVNKTLTNKLGELSAALDKIKAPITVNMNVKGMEELKKAVADASKAVPPSISPDVSPQIDGGMPEEFKRIQSEADGASSALKRFADWSKRVWDKLLYMGRAAKYAGGKIGETGDSAKKGASGLSKFVSSLKRILMYRVVRSILSNIASAAKEGIQNLALYSKAIGGIDASRANAAMSQLATTGLQLKNAFGAALMPVLNALMPVIQTLANWFIIAANAVNQFFAAISGASTWSKAKEYAVDYADGLGKAAGAASDIKNAMLGIDELNIISPNAGGGGGGGGGLDYGSMFEEVPINQTLADLALKIKGIFFDWEDLTLNDIIDKVVVGLGMVTGAVIGWKLGGPVGAIIGTIAGAALAMYFTEFLPDFESLSSKDIQDLIVAGIGGIIGGIVGWKFGGLTGALIGFSIGASITLVLENLKWDNMSTGEKIGTVAAVLGGLVLSLGAIAKLKGLSDAGKAASAAGTIDTAVGKLSPKLSSLAKNLGMGLVIIAEVAAAAILITGAIWVLGKELEQVGLAWQPVIDNGGTIAIAMGIGIGFLAAIGVVTALLGSVGTPLIVNIALGTAILAELGIATGLFLIEIWAIGKGLDEIGAAWQPVIDNGETIAIAMGFGVGILATIGVVTALLGSVGTPLIVNIALGVAILAELGVAAGLFLVEIWAIGKGLDEIGKAWQPVLDNGETIATAIGLGTALLVGIGVVTALLGVATVASVGLLPLAIGLGTALLVELADATVRFVESLVDVANALGNDLAPVLKDLNGKLPGLTTNMSDFVDFMCGFAGEVVRYTGASAVAGLSATIDTIIGWFTQDPIEKMKNDVDKIAGQAKELNNKLNVAVPELKTAVELLGEYVDFVDELGKVADSGGTVNLSEGLKMNLKTVGENIVTGFNDGVKNKYSLVQTTMTNWGKDALKWFNNSSFGGVNKEKFATFANDIVNGFKDKVYSSSGNTKSSITSWASNLKTWFTSSGYGGINKETFGKYATDIVNGFKNGVVSQVESAKSGMTTWANNTKKYFTDIVSYSTFYDIAKDVIKGFNNGINKNKYLVTDSLKSLLNSMLQMMEQFTSKIAVALNDMLSGFARTMGSMSVSSNGSVNFSRMRASSIPRFASGGYVDAGQLFIAREAGPEMVGRIGSRTAVANEQQITTALENAVARGLTSCGGSSGGNWTIQIVDSGGNVKAETIITEAERKNRRDGRTVIPVGV